jgi:hypothetical protein
MIATSNHGYSGTLICRVIDQIVRGFVCPLVPVPFMYYALLRGPTWGCYWPHPTEDFSWQSRKGVSHAILVYAQSSHDLDILFGVEVVKYEIQASTFDLSVFLSKEVWSNYVRSHDP